MTSPGELWVVDFGDPYPAEPAFVRPALVLGPPQKFGEHYPTRIVAPLTTRARGLDVHSEIQPTAESGLDHVSYVQAEQLRSVSRTRLVTRLGAVSPVELTHVRQIVARLLGGAWRGL